jgi:two-component system NtrC family sensor kinase
MFFLPLLAAFLLIRRLQKAVQYLSIRPKWNSLLNLARWSLVAIFILAMVYLNNLANSFLSSLLLLGILVYGDKEPDFAAFRPLFKFHYPLVATGLLTCLVKLIAPDFYLHWGKFFDFTIVAAFIWTFAGWATSKKQQEELRIAAQKNADLDRLVADRTAELTKQKNELQETLVLLQTTQQQLIQSEKLASLGELTAGIAHEIQNPLNFVNNFSEVNTELIDEMREEIAKGNLEEVIAIADDIKENQQKINLHGKRADSIVKGMLQHSRISSGTKELTDVNALADEYLRLAYHGLRAKDKSFNAELVTHFDEKLPKINIVPQDVGRVMLNLFNNAFYAVHQKQKTADTLYKPSIEMSTKLISSHKGGRMVEITVKDNGNGIPDSIKDKIMQPFFTTKPTGEGTGLGLSLSYDIIINGHGGTININSTEGEGSEFIVTLPSR